MVGRFEIAKDTAQVLTESAATHVGRIATIVTGAVREVTRELGEWASDAFEMRDAGKTAASQHATDYAADSAMDSAADGPAAF